MLNRGQKFKIIYIIQDTRSLEIHALSLDNETVIIEIKRSERSDFLQKDDFLFIDNVSLCFHPGSSERESLADGKFGYRRGLILGSDFNIIDKDRIEENTIAKKDDFNFMQALRAM